MKAKIEYCKKYMNLSESTLRSYLGWINRLCKFAGKSKSTEITADDISAFRLFLTEQKLSSRSHGVAYAAINTIYRKMLWRQMSDDFKKGFDHVMSARPKQPQSLPLPDTGFLTRDEIETWLGRIEKPMYNLCASMAYHTGAKLSEICVIPVKNVKPQRLEIGQRSIPIPDVLLKKIAKQKRAIRKQKSQWLFPSPQNPERHISTSILQKILLASRPETIYSGAGVRVFRASFIIHQIRDGADPNWLAYSIGLTGPGGLIPYLKLDGFFI